MARKSYVTSLPPQAGNRGIAPKVSRKSFRRCLNRRVSVRNISYAEKVGLYTEIIIVSVGGSGQWLLTGARKTMI